MQNEPIGVVFDLDGTLTPKRYYSLITVVDSVCIFPDSMKDGMRVLRETYLAAVAKGAASPREEMELILLWLKAYIACGLKAKQWKRALRLVRLRQEAAETIMGLARNGIHVGIISFGVADFVECLLEQNGLGKYVSRVYAAKLITNPRSGAVISYCPDSVVCPFEKDKWSARFASEFGIKEERLFAVGDSSGDRTLGSFKELRLGIAESPREAKAISPFFGQVIVTEGFAPVRKWLREQINRIERKQ